MGSIRGTSQARIGHRLSGGVKCSWDQASEKKSQVPPPKSQPSKKSLSLQRRGLMQRNRLQPYAKPWFLMLLMTVG